MLHDDGNDPVLGKIGEAFAVFDAVLQDGDLRLWREQHRKPVRCGCGGIGLGDDEDPVRNPTFGHGLVGMGEVQSVYIDSAGGGFDAWMRERATCAEDEVVMTGLLKGRGDGAANGSYADDCNVCHYFSMPHGVAG